MKFTQKMNIEFIIEIFATKNMNPNYNVIPCFVEKIPKTILKICVISKHSLWFSIANTSSSSYSSLKKKLLLIFFSPFHFQNFPFPTIPSHIIMTQNNKKSKFKLIKFPN